MRGGRWLGVVALVLVSVVVPVTRGAPPVAAASTWTVDASIASDPTGCNPAQTYKTLTYLFTAAACPVDGDTISLRPGTYSGGLAISKSVSLIGAGARSTTISGGSPVVTVSGANVSISAVTVTGGDSRKTFNAPGGIWNQGTLALSNSTISVNHGVQGGGIANDGTLTVVSSTISGNDTVYTGGGIRNTQALTVINSTITGNTAEGGGGISQAPGAAPLTVTNSTISGNTSTATDGSSAFGGGGIRNNDPGAVILNNSLLAGNTAKYGPDCYGSFADGTGGHNMLGIPTYTTPTSAVPVSCGLTDFVHGDISHDDPKLGPLANNGGPTDTMALLSGSPAIGWGDARTCLSATVGDQDQRGSSRDAAPRSACDAGAYDTATPTVLTVSAPGSVPPGTSLPLTVTAETPLGASVWGYGGTIHFTSTDPQAVLPADYTFPGAESSHTFTVTLKTAGTQTVTVTDNSAPTISASSGPISVSTSNTRYVATTGADSGNCFSAAIPCLTIGYALGQAGIGDTISIAAGNYAGGFTVGKTVTLAGAGARSTSINGGAPVITVSQGAVMKLEGLTVTGGNSSSVGGGIKNDGTLTVANTTINGNTAGGGGGIENGGQLTILQSTLSGNTASSLGGAIYNFANLAVINSTLSGNTSGGSGGAIETYSGSTTAITNSTIDGNGATTGGGIDAVGSVTLSNSIVAGNTVTSGGSGPDCSGTLTDGAGHNLLGNNSACSGLVSGTNGDLVGSAKSPVDPQLGALSNNGGPTDTMALLPGGLAAGAGDANTCLSPSVANQDQRGWPRRADTRNACDIGAFDTASATLMTLQTSAGWNLIGGFAPALLSDSQLSWTWNASSGQWFHPTGNETPGTGAWEELAGFTGTKAEQVAVEPCTPGTPMSVPIYPHRWNMVGNPCDKDVSLPTGVRALLWNRSAYTIGNVIPKGLAAWVLPGSSPLSLTPGGS